MPQDGAARVRRVVKAEFMRAMSHAGHKWQEQFLCSDIDLTGEWNRRAR
jgi:hypothetical protein